MQHLVLGSEFDVVFFGFVQSHFDHEVLIIKMLFIVESVVYLKLLVGQAFKGGLVDCRVYYGAAFDIDS